ncbi:hypothetical protein FQN51_008384 [Onygenales sp. PD_10]|nr:hypothetical protein FQN51_008384 [Onygenales sp. PD_10]
MADQPLSLSIEDDNALPIQQQIFTILTNCLHSSASDSVDAAAKALDELSPDKHPEDPDRQPLGDFLYSFWEPFHSIARQIPHTHPAMDKLVSVIRALKDLPPRQIHVEGWGDYALWRDLPLFGETYSFAFNKDNANNALSLTSLSTRYLNFHSYSARLMPLGIGLDTYCIEDISSTLEGQYDSGKGKFRQIISDPTASPTVDHQMAVVAEWFKHAGETFYLKGPIIGGGPRGPLVKGPGKDEFSKERWGLWKQRLGEFAECQGLPEGTRDLARSIVGMMDGIEARRAVE